MTDGSTLSPDLILAGLDEQQRLVAEALRGPVCVLAGAGTGKTRAITHRIAYGVATGSYTPERVMALTFTTRAAAELRSRLQDLGAERVSARTFHAAALAQLNHFWPRLTQSPAPRVLEGKGRLLGQVAERLRIGVDGAVLRDVAAEIEWRKVTGRSIEEYAAASRPLPGRLSIEQVLDFLRGYELVKDERRVIDFEDVLLAAAGMLENEPQVAAEVHAQYRHFIVDEYQDVSPVQQQLLDLWLGQRRDLCVVGDPSQTIYSFAGASASFLLRFDSRYPDASTITLHHNYRSSPEVLAAASTLMRGQRSAVGLTTTAASGAPVTVRSFDTDSDEAAGVAAQIADLVSRGQPAEKIAVLYRIGAQAAALERALGEAGISYRVRGSAPFFERSEVKQAVMSLRAASLTSVAGGGEPLFKAVSDVLRSLGWTQEPPASSGAVRDRWDSLDAIARLVDEAAAGTSFRKFTDDLLQRAAQEREPNLSAVTLATVHSAKGLEWENVFIIGLSEGLFPIGYADHSEAVDEERRLFYVGLTRARRGLWLSYSVRVGFQRGRRALSRFLREIDSHIPDAHENVQVQPGR